MTVSELINILRSYNPDHEIMISSEEDLWSIDQQSLREATLHETENDVIVDAQDYGKDDGKILSTKEVVLIDLDI